MNLRLILVLTIALAFLTACGAGDSDTETTPGPVMETVAPSITEDMDNTPAATAAVTADLAPTADAAATAYPYPYPLPQTGGQGDATPSVTATLVPLDTQAAAPATRSAEAGTPSAQSGGPAMPQDAVMMFQRSGGLAGVDETWVLYPDGRLLGPDGSESQLGQAGVSSLMQAVELSGFFELEAQYGRGVTPDAYTYIITVQRDGEVHSVTTFEGAPETPASLNTLLQTIRTFLGI